MSYQYNGRAVVPSVELYYDAIPYVGGVSMRDFFLDRDKCVQAWRACMPRLKELVGDFCEVYTPFLPPLSYGHLVCLGAPVQFPENGEPNVSAFVNSIDEAIDVMKARKDMDYTKCEIWNYYFDFWQYLKAKFPEYKIPFKLGVEGPLTSCVLMRGQDFLLDLYDEPEKAKEFIMLMADSETAFARLIRRANDQPERQSGGGLADDFASLVPPDMWPEFVLPALDRHYEGITVPGGRRSAHIENLVPKHMPYLKQLGLSHFQPSVSTALTLENVKANLAPSVEFDWLLYAYHITEMTDAQIQAWVDEVVAAGVSSIRTQVGAYGFMIDKLDRIRAFHEAFAKYEV